MRGASEQGQGRAGCIRAGARACKGHQSRCKGVQGASEQGEGVRGVIGAAHVT